MGDGNEDKNAMSSVVMAHLLGKYIVQKWRSNASMVLVNIFASNVLICEDTKPLPGQI